MADLDQRIEAMYQRDKLGAWLLSSALARHALGAAALLAVVPDGRVRIVLAIGAPAVLVFNTPAIAAMLNHYKTDKQFIYGLDIRTLDALQTRKDGGAA